MVFVWCVVGWLPSSTIADTRGAVDSLTVQQRHSLLLSAKTWAAIKHFHPDGAADPAGWDSRYISAAEAIATSRAAPDVASMLSAMVDSLGDPLTRMVHSNTASQLRSIERPVYVEERTLVIRLAATMQRTDISGLVQSVDRDIGMSEPLSSLIDLRNAPADEGFMGAFETALLTSQWGRRFATGDLPGFAWRARMHEGYAAQNLALGGSPSYFAGIYTQPRGARQGAPATGRKISFLVDPGRSVPDWPLALAGSDRAVIMCGGLKAHKLGLSRAFALTNSLSLQMRVADAVRLADGALLMAVPLGEVADPLPKAISLTSTSIAVPSSIGVGARQSPQLPDPAYAESPYPTLGQRLLGVSRMWAVIQYFFPYRDLMSGSWDDAVQLAFNEVSQANDAAQYGSAIMRLLRATGDSHVSARGPQVDGVFGTGRIPVRLRIVEGKPVVVQLLESDGGQSALKVGDVIERVDDETAGARGSRIARLVATSTQQSERAQVAQRFLDCHGNTLRLSVARRSDQPASELTIPCPPRRQSQLRWRTSDVISWPAPDIAYIDLERLPVNQVDDMFARVKQARAVIFDGRGYPEPTAWSIAPRLTANPTPSAALFDRPMLQAMGLFDIDARGRRALTFMQRLPERQGEVFSGRTFLLVDERTISRGEHTALFLKAANNTTILGSPTAGANGDVTNVVLPGNLLVYLTGQSVRYPDGANLQRRGVIPDVLIEPTIEGIRRGEDEVLTRAIEHVRHVLEGRAVAQGAAAR